MCFRPPPSFSLTLSQEFLRTEATHNSTEDTSALKHLQAIASENKMCMTVKNYTSPKVQANYFFNWANSRINIEPNQSNINLFIKNHIIKIFC